MMEPVEQLKAQESARSIVYGGLADAFRPPAQLSSKRLEELASALARLGSDGLADATRLRESYDAEPEKQILEVEYARLFMGPFATPAPPYGSVYLEGARRMMGDSTADVRRHYLSRGLDLAADFKDAPDHIAAELEFMVVLTRQGLQAIDSGDHNLLADLVRHQGVFLQNHISRWIPAFADKVIEHSRSDFYRCLVMVARTFVAEENEAIQETASLTETQDPAHASSQDPAFRP